MLSNELLGVYTIALSVFAVFNTMLSSGMPVTISRFVSIDDKKEKHHSLVTAGFIISSGLALIICFFVLILKDQLKTLFNHQDSYILIITMLPAVISTGIYTCFRGYLWGKEEFFKSSVVELFEQILRMIICMILLLGIVNMNKVLPPGIAFGAAGVISTILGLYFYFKIGGKLNKPNNYRQLIKTSFPITSVRVLASLLTPLISIIIPFRLMSLGFTSSQALSQLGIMLGMTFPLLSIPSTIIGSLSTALIPDISNLESKKDYRNINEKINNSINFTLFLTFIILPPFIALGNEICDILFGNGIAGDYLMLSAWIMIPMGITQLTTTILNSMGLERKTFYIYLVSGSLLLFCIWFLPQFVGIKAIIYAIGISNIINCILNLIQIRKHTKLKVYYYKKILVLSLLAVFPILLVSQLNNLLSLIFPNFINLFILAPTSILLYFLLLFTFNIAEIKIIFNSLILKFKNKNKNSMNIHYNS